MNTQLGLALKERGLDAVEHSHETWIEAMRAYAKKFSYRFGEVTADDVRQHARNVNWQPDKPNAYGAIFRGKGWQAIGRTRSTWPGNHGRSIIVWRWAG